MLLLFSILGVMGFQCMRWMIIKACNYVVRYIRMYYTLMIVYSVYRYCGSFTGRGHLYKLSTWGVLNYDAAMNCLIWLHFMDITNFGVDPDDWMPEGFEHDALFEFTYYANLEQPVEINDDPNI